MRGAQLLGAGQALNQHGLDIGTLSPNTPFEDAFERDLEARLRAALGDDDFEREYAYRHDAVGARRDRPGAGQGATSRRRAAGTELAAGPRRTVVGGVRIRYADA